MGRMTIKNPCIPFMGYSKIAFQIKYYRTDKISIRFAIRGKKLCGKNIKAFAVIFA